MAFRHRAYGAPFWLACHVFVVGCEERTLRRMFGVEYEGFRANVPRWLPRRRPSRSGESIAKIRPSGSTMVKATSWPTQ
jgi:hypothetical protein